MHWSGQCSTSQSIKHRLCVRTRKIALECAACTCKKLWKMPTKLCSFIREHLIVYIYQITPFFPCGLCSSYRAALFSIVRNENKRHMDSFSRAFPKRWGWTTIYCWIYIRLQPCKWRTTVPKRTSIVWTRPNSLTWFPLNGAWTRTSRNSKWGTITANRSSKCPPKSTVDYFSDFKLYQSSPSGSALTFSGAKRMLLQAPKTHLNCQEIVYLERFNENEDYIFTGGLKVPYLMMGIGSHVRLLHFCIQIMGSRRSSQTPEAGWQVDENLEKLFSCSKEPSPASSSSSSSYLEFVLYVDEFSLGPVYLIPLEIPPILLQMP